MDSIVTLVVPLFSVIFIGFAVGKLGGIDQAGVRTLVAFVFSLAMPALIFRLMAGTDIGGIDDWPVAGAYLSAQLPIFIGGLMIGGWLLRQSMAETTIQAFGSSFSNGVVLGLPLVLSLYGERAAVPALLIIMLDIAIFSVITLLLEIASLRDKPDVSPRLSIMLRDLVLSVGSNPLILSTVLGVGFGASELALPGAVDKTLAFLGQAGPPAGLFALGATLGLRNIKGQVKPVAAMMLMKLILHPILAWFAVVFLFDLDPVAMSVMLLFAACPVGANVYVFAAHYGAALETSATAILLSTAVAMITLSGLALLLSQMVV
ncbi:MAG: AEC family transporter [Geminicoccaceae bacterium]